eukprot:CAMPEP_0197622168 /NCGR_PEP_ID=MMETSP1338-20131121/2556_1 /TAXON_ID=43686 ORGANISM="Pelagodinium beii, Strain RCC1491" /NCGR_SAMPLE_ID=MMETSP1338 /ASSEMBLY_ACC=CAM_ASM_000754 /LENGTH=51 /DNA_ID=CAMNT_0043191839 /DNA_START=117 /DNA_END=272 /DNA_ORIENTATION=-
MPHASSGIQVSHVPNLIFPEDAFQPARVPGATQILSTTNCTSSKMHMPLAL